jgi:CRISPR-associated endonuclease/helicase Cas3
MNDRLLAKSRPRDHKSGDTPPESIFLPNHLRDVYFAAKQVLNATADDQLNALGLDLALYGDRLRRVVLLAAALHDLGKANDHFQGMVLGCRRDPQGLRHEWVSLLLIEEPRLREWLLPAVGSSETDLLIASWAITGHHPAYGRPSPPRLAVEGGGAEMKLLVGRRDFAAALDWVGEAFNLQVKPPKYPPEPASLPLLGPQNAFKRIFEFYRRSSSCWSELPDADRSFVAAVKDSLIAADVAGSALVRGIDDEQGRADWIAASFRRRPTAEELENVVRDRLAGRQLRDFQRDVAQSTAQVTLVKAGCGTGKSLAAYEWARVRYPGKRLYFCYPTTGTATEGFRDYLVAEERGKFGARLFHGRADIDLEMLGVQEYENDRDADMALRIESLDAWSTPIVSCTVDAVLGLVQNNRRPLYAWPALAGAAFVFDEIHAYDDRLFGALLRFLAALPGAPALLMTASLPRARHEAVERCLQRADRQLSVIDGPAEQEELPRYHRLLSDASTSPLETIHREIASGGNVLWICNTVDRVMRAADEAAGLNPIVYHSRFRYKDRVKRHERTIDAFQSGKQGSLAICSQVAEVSLDLKGATLLVTDLAPVPALVQRLGRLNRHASPGDATRPFAVIEPENANGQPSCLPYTPEEFRLARLWLDKLPANEINQKLLAKAWEQLDEAAVRRPALIESAWLDGGPITQVLELREASPGITILLNEDAESVRQQPRLLPKYALPMPPPPSQFSKVWRNWDQINGVPVAPPEAIEYDAQRGAKWVKPKS